MLWLTHALCFSFLPQTNSHVRPFNFCISTISNFTVHFQVRKSTDVFLCYSFLNVTVLLSFLCNDESLFDTFQYFFRTCLSFFSAPNNEILADPTGTHFSSDLCAELLDWSFTLSTAREVDCDLVIVYLFYTVFFSIGTFPQCNCMWRYV